MPQSCDRSCTFSNWACEAEKASSIPYNTPAVLSWMNHEWEIWPLARYTKLKNEDMYCSDNFEIILARLGLSSIAGNAPPIRQIFEEVFKTEQQQYWQLSIASVKSPVSSNLGCCQFVWRWKFSGFYEISFFWLYSVNSHFWEGFHSLFSELCVGQRSDIKD